MTFYNILNRTACKVGSHVWLYPSVLSKDDNPPDDWHCDCKRWRWDEMKEMQRQEASVIMDAYDKGS